ncbi:MAG: alpha-amylase family glycosyl hydrolase [Chloroflexota bacterium]
MRRCPVVYEANARLLLRALSAEHGRALTLSSIPDGYWQGLADAGIDAVWLMGVWQRSSSARRVALGVPGLRREFDHALPDWTEADVAGSPYAVYSYSLDAELGGPEDLEALRTRLSPFGLSLILDFVPNHVALDHPWVRTHPQRFVGASTLKLVELHPDWFYSPNGHGYVAHGRDPFFAPWTDTAQVNFFSEDLREALTQELLSIAEVCDGVRCDMAMLALNRVFEGTWGEALGDVPRPRTEFWADAIGRVWKAHPGFVFLAEAYWGTGAELRCLGFDYTYDKGLYDGLRWRDASAVRDRLAEESVDPDGWARFTENHDEERAATAFGKDRSVAAATAVATLPGLRLFHRGQEEGRTTRTPVQLIRERDEPADPDLRDFYNRLWRFVCRDVFHEGEWELLHAGRSGDGNDSHEGILAWGWQLEGERCVVAINYSGSQAQARIKLPDVGPDEGVVEYRDELTGDCYTMDAAEIRDAGLYVDLSPWGCHILSMPRR